MPQPWLAGGIAILSGFVENRGQWLQEVLFFARRGGVEATVARDALVFLPSTSLQVPLQVASPQGSLDLTFAWPTVAAGAELTAQAWFFDPGAPQGWSASNALTMIGQ